jgi:squalene-hopene/tetraprenyl-beta-curcumene cyclase
MGTSLNDEIPKIIKDAQKRLLSEKYGVDYWKYQACLGTHFVAQFFLLSRWLGEKLELFDEAKFKKILIDSQKDDGSWLQWPDLNPREGDLDATIIHYFALKILGVSPDLPAMKKAKRFILKNGGMEKGTLFIQVIMALFGNLPWKNIPSIPYLIFIEGMPCNYKSFSHWSKPHVMAFSYLRKNKTQKDLGEKFRLEELKKNPTKVKIESRLKPTSLIDGPVINKILKQQLHHGSWNGYTTSTLFSVVALSDYESFHPNKNKNISSGIKRGLKFLQDLYLDERANPYLGVSCDGRNWDTLLVLSALTESGMSPKELEPFFEFTKQVQSPNGGVGYGIDFKEGPDVDDTAEAVKLWATNKIFFNESSRAIKWLLDHQNTVGGWGAFDRDNESSTLMKIVTKGFEDSDSLFDFPSADCTGHALEAFADAGVVEEYKSAIDKAITFLKKKQDPRTGSWQARWAVNHIFGTHVALSGLLKVGEDVNSAYIQKAIKWMASIQNPDGGFGENTDSYIDRQYIGKGLSTPSQTAWGMMTLMACDFSKYHNQILKAADYLVNHHKKNGSWTDGSPVGTGHPGSVYMQYNSYGKAFPLMALAKLAKRF